MSKLPQKNLKLSEPPRCGGYKASVHALRKNAVFPSLVITTTISLLLVASNERQWSVTGHSYVTLNKHAASVQIAVQLISSSFGLLQHNVICQLFNYATRLRFRKTPPTLDVVYAWNSISAGRVAWDLRLKLLLPTLVFALGLYVPSALWAGAITPTLVVKQILALASLRVPQFSNSTMVRE